MRIEEKKNKIILKTVDVGSWPHALATLALHSAQRMSA